MLNSKKLLPRTASDTPKFKSGAPALAGHRKSKISFARRRPHFESLERRELLAGVDITISDASAIEGSNTLKTLDRFVEEGSGLARPRTPLFGPDGNGDGLQDLYVVSSDTHEILRFNGQTGSFLDTFVAAGSGGLVNPFDIAFGPDGDLYVSDIAGQGGTPGPAGSGSVLRYNGSTGAFIDAVATGLTCPDGITFGPDGSLFIAEQELNQVDRVSSGVLSVFVAPGSGGLNRPRNALFGRDINGDGFPELYVSSNTYDAVLRYNGQTGAFIDKFASTGMAKGPAWMEFAPDGTLVATTASSATCCNQTFVRFDGTTGAKIDAFDTGRDGWSFNFGPDGLIYSSGNGGGNFVDRVGASSIVAFTVSLSAPSNVPVSVAYATANGTAAAGSDYQAITGTITFAPGQTTRGILISTFDDTSYEGNETFTINLSAPVGAIIADGQGVATITDNESPPTKFYVVNDGSPDRTYEYGASGSAVENYAINSGNSAPRGAASTIAGDKVWVVDTNKNVYVYNTSGGLLGSWSAGSLPANADVQGVTTNGTDVWIVDAKGDKVYKYAGAATRLAGSQTAVSSFSLNTSNSTPKDLVTDGTSIWVVNSSGTDRIFKYTVSGSLLGKWSIDPANSSPTGITIDPSNVSNIWIVDNVALKIFQYNAAATRTSGSQTASATYVLSSGNTNPQGIADPPPPSSEIEPAVAGDHVAAANAGSGAALVELAGTAGGISAQQASASDQKQQTASSVTGSLPNSLLLSVLDEPASAGNSRDELFASLGSRWSSETEAEAESEEFAAAIDYLLSENSRLLR